MLQPFSVLNRRARTAALAFASALALVACGGGGGGGDDDDGGGGGGEQRAGVYASGRVEGYGSVVVNGVHYDHASATVRDEDGNTVNSAYLRLGTVVDVVGGPISVDASGVPRSTASELRFASQIRGPVTALGADSMTVLGQTVSLSAITVFEGFTGGRAGLDVGDLVEVSGFLDAGTGAYAASRVEFEDHLNGYRLQGRVANLNTGAQTFTIGGATISYAAVASGDRPPLENGLLVRALLQTTQQSGAWVATELRDSRREVEDVEAAEVEGYVSGFASLAEFQVDGLPVDASGAGVDFEDGSSAGVVDGVRVEVEGEILDGVLVARKVEFEDDDDDEDKFEVSGLIESINLLAQTFVVQGVTVEFAGATLEGGTLLNLQTGARVEVEGGLTDSGAQLDASVIRFDD
ncbi:DUF5666 domain-containing protein [Schlegelella sp. S2-27]|uniref:DUF5666 domain-containing protein n=1 Tax=Caldimonas mangrovi TaxID=2944811 RepID=A0ABT0YNR3_9BURK|nr:DUF5666 domain-containing protein [Caldimonas mangrovi]MCM5679518.1 DUF5666 domain-containing protein [Caldimonas mangrovi]